MKKLLYTAYMFLITIVPISSFALVVEVPPSQGNQDVIVTGPTLVQGDERTIFETIQLVNKYLRFAIGVICLGVLIYGGFLLMTAEGSEDKMKQANKLILGAVVGILIAIFSYAFVRLIVNLF